MSASKSRAGYAAAILLAVALSVGLALQHRTIVDESPDPTGAYVARVSYYTFYSFIPGPPGSSSDKPVFVEIFKKGGASLGRIPVPMLQMSAVRWERDGASVDLVGEWDFVKDSCFYWDESQNHKIYVRGHE